MRAAGCAGRDWLEAAADVGRQLHGLAKEPLPAVADVRENYGGAAEDHHSHGDVQQETQGG